VRLLRFKVDRAASCGELLAGLTVTFDRIGEDADQRIAPLCLVGPNGSGKSQFLQLLAEVLQVAWHAHAPNEERKAANSKALFELEYSIAGSSGGEPVQVLLSRAMRGRSAGPVEMTLIVDGKTDTAEPGSQKFGQHLPSLIVGYTSGDNETMSQPFFVSRGGYADDVAKAALGKNSGKTRGVSAQTEVSDNRLLLIDYGTNLEVLVANLMLANEATRRFVIEHAKLSDLASCRCLVRLAHSAAPKAPRGAPLNRKGIQLTPELEATIGQLKRVSTCWRYDEKQEIYTFDFFVDEASRAGFRHFFEDALNLYKKLHKLALLNDLAIPKQSRERLGKEIDERRFASRLPQPQQEDMVFVFEAVRFRPIEGASDQDAVDYVSLSDGEHQQALILGIFSMIREENALFLLDEPESHFNPLWRVQFVKRLMDIPGDVRGRQEVLLTSHAPFVPSDLRREQVLIFSRSEEGVSVRNPDIETYGATFDRILENCFEVRPPISQLARDEIKYLQTEGSADEIRAAMERLGSSVEKAFLSDRLRQLEKHP
jgi:restriction system-associated AAA family ATPase